MSKNQKPETSILVALGEIDDNHRKLVKRMQANSEQRVQLIDKVSKSLLNTFNTADIVILIDKIQIIRRKVKFVKDSEILKGRSDSPSLLAANIILEDISVIDDFLSGKKCDKNALIDALERTKARCDDMFITVEEIASKDYFKAIVDRIIKLKKSIQ